MPHSNIEMIPIGQLRPNPNNVRTHSRRQVRQIAASIQKFGFLSPIVADDTARRARRTWTPSRRAAAGARTRADPGRRRPLRGAAARLCARRQQDRRERRLGFELPGDRTRRPRLASLARRPRHRSDRVRARGDRRAEGRLYRRGRRPRGRPGQVGRDGRQPGRRRLAPRSPSRGLRRRPQRRRRQPPDGRGNRRHGHRRSAVQPPALYDPGPRPDEASPVRRRRRRDVGRTSMSIFSSLACRRPLAIPPTAPSISCFRIGVTWANCFLLDAASTATC